MIDFYKMKELESLIQQLYMKHNGKVNTIVPCKRVILDWDVNPNTCQAFVECGQIVYGITNLYRDFYSKETDPLPWIEFCVIHELSHLDQNIEVWAYKADPMYLKKIEDENDLNTLDYMNRTGSLSESRLVEYYSYLRSLNIQYTKVTPEGLIERAIWWLIKRFPDIKEIARPNVGNKIIIEENGCHVEIPITIDQATFIFDIMANYQLRFDTFVTSIRNCGDHYELHMRPNEIYKEKVMSDEIARIGRGL